MTYSKTVLLTAAAALAFSSTALAGDMKKTHDHDAKTHAEMETETKLNMDDTAKVTVTQDVTVDTTMMEPKTDVRGVVTKNYIGDILQSNETNVKRSEGDDKLLMSVGDTDAPESIAMEERDSTARNNAIAVPTTDGQFVTTVSCPVGTTAQPDMTCLVTGDYESSL